MCSPTYLLLLGAGAKTSSTDFPIINVAVRMKIMVLGHKILPP